MAYNYSTSLYVGETTRGRPQSVFWDTHTAVFNDKPPGCIITGGPGAGKTFWALTLTAQSTILGKTTVAIDPKGDFLSLNELKGEIGEFVLLDLGRGKTGVLDPFYMSSDPTEQMTLAIEVIDIFVGGLKPEYLTVLGPIVQDVARGTNPSLQKVVDELRGSERQEARDLGAQLNIIKSMKFAKLCFAPGNIKRQSIKIDKGLTVITLVGLELPEPGKAYETRGGRLASGILFLLTDFLRRVMHTDESKGLKTIIIDEAHALISNEVGARTVKQLALLGRSKNLALVLITQSYSHLEHLDFENTVSTRFAFRTDQKDAGVIVKAMGLPEGGEFESLLTNLRGGECLMSDFMGRYSTVQISAWKTNWKEAFNANPLEKMRRRKQQEAAEREAAGAS